MRRLITMALTTVLAVFLCVAVAGITTGCGSSVCDDACDKLEQCNPGSTCTSDGQSDDVCQCIVDTPCADIANDCLNLPFP